MKTKIIIHGHFYQPPRDNPDTGLIPKQSSAKPYANWNEAIYKTCYIANAYSRYLTSNGRVESITNNYCNISADFGPTLLNWTDSYHPEFMSKIIEADKYSISTFGHSNFLAQSYNHTILPLDKRKIKEVEVAWALEDYKHRFGHKPEGFWCPECAVDKETIDVLAQAGIQFIILSPWQWAQRKKTAPCDRPFLLKGEKHTITAFFYDGEMASAVSFGHILRNADAMYDSLLQLKKSRNNPKLISWATDGEIYGHHEPFGDMALAALIKKIQEGDDFELTNYGAYLEENPATEYAELWLGEDNLGSSWSCNHGVGRWYRDCGCSTGGDPHWNQKWRTGLRKAFNRLEESASQTFEDEITRIFGSDLKPWELLKQYGAVLCKKTDLESFISKAAGKYSTHLSKEDFKTTAKLLDMMKNVLFSFTSCGWFFNDISGIEPTQNILYAECAATELMDLGKNNAMNSLFKDLREARSNIPHEGTGEDIARRAPGNIPSFAQAAGYFALNRKISKAEDYSQAFGTFKLTSMTGKTMEFINSRNLEKYRLSYITKQNGSNFYEIDITNLNTGYTYSYTSNDISKRTLNEISTWVDKKLAHAMNENMIDEITQSFAHFMMLIKADRAFAREQSFYDTMNLCLKAVKAQTVSLKYKDWDETLARIVNLARFVRQTGRMSDTEDFLTIVGNCLKNLHKKVSEANALRIIALLKAVRSEGFEPDITETQNVFYPILVSKETVSLSESTGKELAINLNFSV